MVAELLFQLLLVLFADFPHFSLLLVLQLFLRLINLRQVEDADLLALLVKLLLLLLFLLAELALKPI